MEVDGAGTSSAKRRERRLRSMLRHERQTVAMELAAALHHSRDGERATFYGLRAPKTASSGERPGVLTEPEPQGQERPWTFPRRSQVAPEPQPLLHLGVGEVHDGPQVAFLLQHALLERKRGGRRRGREKEEQEEFDSLSAVERRTPQQNRRLAGLFPAQGQEGKEEEEEEADASDLLSLSSWPRSASTPAVACTFCWFCW